MLLGGLAVADGAAAGGLQLVRVLPGARRVVAAGGRVGGVRRGSFALLAVPGDAAGGAGASSPAGSACTACVLAVRRVVRAAAAARRAAGGDRAAGGGAGARSRRRPCWSLRLALWGGERTLAQALAELALWLAGLALATRRLESGLLAELRGYLRPGGERPSWDAGRRSLVARDPRRPASRLGSALLWPPRP